MENGKVSDATRIERVLPTIREIADKGGKVVLLAHFGRPKGGPDEANSLRPVAAAVAEHLGRPVGFCADCIGDVAASAIAAMKDGDVLLLENTRFHKGEEKNDPAFVAELAKLGDLYVNDAFSAAHRAHASTEGVAHQLPCLRGPRDAGRTRRADAGAGDADRDRSRRSSAAPRFRPSSICSAISSSEVDVLVIGGGMANTFLFAQGKPVGKSLCEKDLADTARSILEAAEAAHCRILLPVDATVAKEFKAHAPSRFVDVDHVADDEMILDIGPKSIAAVEAALDDAKTLVWNGPFGAFELPPFDAAHDADRQDGGVADRGGQAQIGRRRRRHRRRR